MTIFNCDLTALKEETEKIIKADYNEYYLRDDLYAFLEKLTNIRDSSVISAETKSEIDQLISKVDKKLSEVRYSISMDPNGGMSILYFEDWD